MTLQKVHLLWRKGLQALLILMMGLLLAIMMAQVIMRYGFNNSLIWAEEVCRYLLIWLSMLALFFAYERGEIASVRMGLYALPRRIGFLGAIVGNMFALLLCGLFVYYGYKYATIVGSQPIPALRFIINDLIGESVSNIPTVFWVYAVLPFGMGLLGLKILGETFGYIKGYSGPLTLEQYHLENAPYSSVEHDQAGTQ